MFSFSLDYDVNIVANPDTTVNGVGVQTGSCTAGTAIDNIAVTSGSGAKTPVICGFNSGQHSKAPKTIKNIFSKTIANNINF